MVFIIEGELIKRRIEMTFKITTKKWKDNWGE